MMHSFKIGVRSLLFQRATFALLFCVLLYQCIAWGALADAATTNPRPTSLDDTKDQKPLTCVSHTTSVRYIMGFDHLVHIRNACEKTAYCTVATDVNPSPQAVTVAPGASETVLTYRGSPARVFRANVVCQLSN